MSTQGQLEENWRNPDGTLKAGHPPMGGRPSGSLDFKTKWFRLIDKLSEQNNLTPEEIEEQLIGVGFKRAQGGDFRFYKDIMDRVYGKPVEPIDVSGSVQTNYNLEDKELIDNAIKDAISRGDN